jgi:hypothetical protein
VIKESLGNSLSIELLQQLNLIFHL